MRLDKLLAHAGYGTRKEVNQLIKNESVLVNQKVITKGNFQVDLNNDIVMVDDLALVYQEKSYLMMNKPAGYLCAHHDRNHQTVFELIDEYIHDIFTVGRLDLDTEGLLLLTNDGSFAHNIISGKKHIEKEYEAILEKPFDRQYIKSIEQGIVIDNDQCKPGKIQILTENVVRLTISEGKYHQVKRMMQACNNQVVYLKRLRIGGLWLDEQLALGEYRHLTANEIVMIEKGAR